MPQTAGPVSPGAISFDSAPSSRRASRSSFEFDLISQVADGRHPDEESGSYRLLDYFVAILSDVISHDCRYRVQHPRPSRPEWILHSIVLDILFFLSKELAYDQKAIHDLGVIALSAFPIFKHDALIRLMDLLTDTILPSFALSRIQPSGSSSQSPPLIPLSPGSPLSPSEIRVQLDNNQTFAIQVHSPTEEQGMLAVPRGTGQSSKSPRVPSSRSSSISLSRSPRGFQDSAMDAHVKSLVALTLLAILQQVPFSRSPLPVAKQLQKSIGDLLRIKPDLSADVLEMVAIVDSEMLMRRAIEVLWWIGSASLGHHVLGEKLNALDYESILLVRQGQQECNSSTGGTRNTTMKSDAPVPSRKATLEEKTIHRGDVATRGGTATSSGIRSKFSNRITLPRKISQGPESIPLYHAQQGAAVSPTVGVDLLADHELYPFMFTTPEGDQDGTLANHCERCELSVKGFGLYCYHSRSALHLECFYSLKRFSGVDCMQLGCALDSISRRNRHQLMYPLEKDLYESTTTQTFRIRDGHHLQLVNLFSTCLCSVCRLPLWGYHHQAYKCRDCGQLLHGDCKGTSQGCSVSQPLALRHLFPTTVSYVDLRQSFQEFYSGLISSWESQPAPSPVSGTSPTGFSSTQPKHRYLYEEASCNASALTLQLELLRAGIVRGEIQVHELNQENQIMDENLMVARGFELFTLQKYFVGLEQTLRAPTQPPSHSFHLSDFFEDVKPDSFLLFSTRYWSHLSALAKTMIKEAEATQLGYGQNFLTSQMDGLLQGDSIFAQGPDSGHDKLLAKHSVRTDHLPLETIYRFCMRRMGFQSAWTMQLVLQEWVKIGLLERLDGEVCLFENTTQDYAVSPLGISPPLPYSPTAQSGSGPSSSNGHGPALPTFQKSYFDISVGSGSRISKIRNVHCLFPMVTAIDPTSDVENLIQAIWRCLSSIDLSVNECGFLLLTRQGWPDPFMSDYTKERLLGCVFHWLLMEDDQLFVIHKAYASKGRKIPGVRVDLEEHMAKKRTTENIATISTATPAMSVPTTRATSGTMVNAGNTAGSLTVGVSMAGLASGLTQVANSRNNTGFSPSHFGTVGSYVTTRKLISKRFALPWLKQLMDLDPKGYVDMVYRQIRVMEREMAAEGEGEYHTEEQEQVRSDPSNPSMLIICDRDYYPRTRPLLAHRAIIHHRISAMPKWSATSNPSPSYVTLDSCLACFQAFFASGWKKLRGCWMAWR